VLGPLDNRRSYLLVWFWFLFSLRLWDFTVWLSLLSCLKTPSSARVIT